MKVRAILTALVLLMSSFSMSYAATPTIEPVPTPAPSPCDPNYYESLRSRAWLEAQREVTQNQNLIFKPDSVLQYTCFDKFLNEVAQDASNMFSETNRWGNILGPTSMDDALENLVGVTLRQYLTQNFNHSVLGGRSTAFAYQPAASVTGGAYSCDTMIRVWQEAKCSDFMRNAPDGFFTFEQYADPNSNDHRWLPTSCGPALPTWAENIGTAYVDLPRPNTNDTFTPWTEDNVVTYLERMDPTKCGAGTNPQAVFPVQTGVVVERTSQAPNVYNESVCIPAGCYYDPAAKECVRP